MLPTLSAYPAARTGRSEDGVQVSGRGRLTSLRANTGRRAVASRFGQLLESQGAMGVRDAAAQPATGTSRSSQLGQTQPLPLHPPHTALIVPYQRGTSAQPTTVATPAGLSTAKASTDVTSSMKAASAAPKSRAAEIAAFDAEWGARYWPNWDKRPYMDAQEIIGSIAPRVAGSGPGNTAFASNLYRVPEWGLQDFVTSDGTRHRFDVEVVFPEAGATTWLGNAVGQVHPEVASFVVENLRKTMAAGGIPMSAVAEIKAFRSHGGPAERPFYMDNLQFVRADGAKFTGSMNIYMRDPVQTLQVLRDFFLADIPS